jgi:hypothetical protein
MNKIYGIIAILLIMLFGFFIINVQPYIQSNNSNILNNTHIFVITNSDLQQHSHLISANMPSVIPTIGAENYIQFQLALYPNSELSSFMALRDNGVSNSSDFVFSVNGYYIQSGYNVFNQTFVMPYSPILPDTLLVEFADTNIISANLNISMENYYATNVITGLSFAQTLLPFTNTVIINPILYTYNSATYKTGSNFDVPNYVYYANMYSYNTNNIYYTVHFIGNTNFALKYNNQNFSSISDSLTLLLQNGSYTFVVYQGNSTFSFTQTILGNSTVNVDYYKNATVKLQSAVYIGLTLIMIIAIMRMSGNLFIIYGISSLFFILIGFELNLQYFGISLIMTIITLIAGLFVYKVILE